MPVLAVFMSLPTIPLPSKVPLRAYINLLYWAVRSEKNMKIMKDIKLNNHYKMVEKMVIILSSISLAEGIS